MSAINKYRALNNEANYTHPIISQVKGGTHIACEMITKRGGTFYMTRWPHGLPRHDDPPNTLRFPHGLIIFGETMEQCALRLVKDQLGMVVTSVRVLQIDSYVDKDNHWHIEPISLVEVNGTPELPQDVSEIITFDLDHIPRMTYWKRDELLGVLHTTMT